MVHASRNLLFDRANDERPRSLWFVGEKEKNRIRSFSCRCVTWWWLLKSFRPPRKIQISYSLHFNTWLFSILSGFFNLWLWWSRAEGAAAAVWLQKSLGCDVILWKRIDFSCTTRLLFFSCFCLVLLFFMLRTGNDHFRLWWNDIAAHGYCCRLFSRKKKQLDCVAACFFIL
jgi:hypothetical protein